MLRGFKRANKFILKTYLKIWSGFTKFIRAQTTQKKSVDTLILGKFKIDSKIDTKNVDSDVAAEFGTFYYQPLVKFMDEAEITLHENDYNLNPYSQEFSEVVKMNFSSIAQVCKCKVETVTHVLNEFSKRLVSICKKSKINNQIIVLNMKIGFLKIHDQKIRFLNHSEIRKRGKKETFSNPRESLKAMSDVVSSFIESLASQRGISLKSSKVSS